MDKRELTEILELAKECAKDETEFKKETFIAVSIGLILRKDMMSPQDNVGCNTTPPLGVPISGPPKRLSLREVILEKNPSNNHEKALCIGYYEEKYEGKTSWTTQDLVQGFKNAKEPIPTNPSDTIAKCRQKGWIMESDGGYMLTKSGEQLVEAGFKISG